MAPWPGGVPQARDAGNAWFPCQVPQRRMPPFAAQPAGPGAAAYETGTDPIADPPVRQPNVPLQLSQNLPIASLSAAQLEFRTCSDPSRPPSPHWPAPAPWP
ncbi:hypothetical protein CXK98_03990 [Stutzerimonas kunmingensis]|nr:hypothetical protein CXK98_03990 [Stutzerimonas kunmingensis]